MPDILSLITKVIEEHHAIRTHVKLAGDTVNDIEALIAIRSTSSGWQQSSVDALIEKRNQLQQAVSLLEKGLGNHFAFEEKIFPPLFGELLMKAVLREHNEIRRQIANVKTILTDTRLEGIDQRQLLTKKTQMQDKVNSLCNAVDQHAGHEEIILGVIKKGLE